MSVRGAGGCLTVPLHAHRLWRAASREATQSLRAWEIAPAGERSRAYFDYCVALEREDRAAAVLADGTSS